MTVRDIHEWAASPAIEYVTANRMNAIAQSFGQNRLIATSTPDLDLVLSGTHYVCLDYLQTPYLRVCFDAEAIASPSATPSVIFNVYSRSSFGGPESNNSTYYAPGGGSGYTALWPLMPLPLCDKFRDPWSWAESGRSDDQYDTEGFKIPIEYADPNVYWAQICLLKFTSPLAFDGFADTRHEAYPQNQRLLLEITFDEPTTGDMDNVKNLMVYEWPRHPDTPNFYLDYNRDPYNLYSVAYYQDKSDYSVGAGSTYDIFRGR